MRAREFIYESREDVEGMTIEMTKHGHQLVINALDDWGNKLLGFVIFNIGDDNELDPQELEVMDQYRGQGIARVMYDYVKSKGYKIVRSYDQTDDGKHFWDKNRGEDVRIWEDELNEVSRRDFLRYGAAAAATATAPGLAQAGQYMQWDDMWKSQQSTALWEKRYQQLSDRFDRIVARLLKFATPEQLRIFNTYKYEIADVRVYAKQNVKTKTISLDLSVYWDLSDDTIAFSTAHELGHAFYQHGAYEKDNPRENYNRELLADAFGVKLAARAGYNPAKCFNDFTRKEKEAAGDETHPSYQDRVKHIRQETGITVSHLKRGVQLLDTPMNQIAQA